VCESSANGLARPDEFETLTDAELLAALRERFNALGLMPDAGTDTRPH
jgi:hypothetical protein